MLTSWATLIPGEPMLHPTNRTRPRTLRTQTMALSPRCRPAHVRPCSLCQFSVSDVAWLMDEPSITERPRTMARRRVRRPDMLPRVPLRDEPSSAPDDVPEVLSVRARNSREESWDDYIRALERTFAQYLDRYRQVIALKLAARSPDPEGEVQEAQ